MDLRGEQVVNFYRFEVLEGVDFDQSMIGILSPESAEENPIESRRTVSR